MKLSLHKANSEQRELDDAFSTMIRSRDNWQCAICGADRNLACHHIIPREHKEFRYCEDNALTLCVTHHKFSRVISAHNSPLAFYEWLKSYKQPLFFIATRRIKNILGANGIQLN